MKHFAFAATGAALVASANLALVFAPGRESSSPAPALTLPISEPARIAVLTWPNVPASGRSLFAPPERAALPPISAPSPPPVVPMLPQNTSKEEPQLVGIVGIDDNRFALVQIEGQSELRKVAEGEEFEGWNVIRIGPRSLELSRRGEKKTLHLDPPT